MRVIFLLMGAALIHASAQGSETGGPGPGFRPGSEPPEISPDGSIQVEQFFKPGDGYIFQFWTFNRHHGHAHLLNSGETGILTEYGAGFRFTPDSQWLVRMQKIAAGESTLFLYKRSGEEFRPATAKRLGDLAWDYFFTRPESRGIDRNNLSPETYLVKGVDDNYRWLGKRWPGSHYLVIDLVSGESATIPIGPWRCLYEMATDKFSVPPDFAQYNRKQMPWK
jgi:hypothetical protein